MKTLFEVLQQFGPVYESLPTSRLSLSNIPFWLIAASGWTWNPGRFGADLSTDIRILALYVFAIDPSQSEMEQLHFRVNDVIQALNNVEVFEDSQGHQYYLKTIEAEVSQEALQKIQLQHQNIRALGFRLSFAAARFA